MFVDPYLSSYIEIYYYENFPVSLNILLKYENLRFHSIFFPIARFPRPQ